MDACGHRRSTAADNDDIMISSHAGTEGIPVHWKVKS